MKAVITLLVALFLVPAANAQWADPADIRSVGRDEIVEVARVTLDAAPQAAESRVPDPVVAPRPPVPAPPVITSARASVPTTSALRLAPSPTYNYQGCYVNLNVTGASDGTVITFQMKVMDMGAFNEAEYFFTPPYFTLGTATVVNGTATLRVRNNAASSYLFKATAGATTSNEYPVGWVENPSKLPCLT